MIDSIGSESIGPSLRPALALVVFWDAARVRGLSSLSQSDAKRLSKGSSEPPAPPPCSGTNQEPGPVADGRWN